nr:MAG TPA: hypothetical protein [Caudoviricetes sp.]
MIPSKMGSPYHLKYKNPMIFLPIGFPCGSSGGCMASRHSKINQSSRKV